MSRQVKMIPHKVNAEYRPDGSIILTSGYDLPPAAHSSIEWLEHWARETPRAVFLAERSGSGWREINYGETRERTRLIAGALLEWGLQSGDRLLILSGNSIDHALITLAAQHVGIATVPVAEQYSLIPEARDRLCHIARKTRPALVFAQDAARFSSALMLPELAELPAIASMVDDAPRRVTPFDDLLTGDGDAALEDAMAQVGPDTVAKILFTSGSTSMPKGVCTTQRMMCVNQAQISQAWPFVAERPPRIVDWLPWNHVFGSSHNFNMMLANGGALYIDDGKPAPGLFDRTLENLASVTGTMAFNVPAGWKLMAAALKQDSVLRRRFLADLDMIFYAGAALPAELWAELHDIAQKELGRVPLMLSSWGMTETAPAATTIHQPVSARGNIGVPMAGVTARLVPDSDGRFELRVKGPNVMTSYLNDPEKTAAPFDSEGFLLTGDAVRFVDPKDPSAGLAFDGRISENFKLSSGTWVHSARLREMALGVLGALAQDVVVTGHDRDEIGLLIFPGPAIGASTLKADGFISDSSVMAQVQNALAPLADTSSGSSGRIRRAAVLADPPSVRNHEITAKGNLNINAVLKNRAKLIDVLYGTDDSPVIVV